MRKDPKAVSQWNPGLVESCARLQREIVEALWPLLRPGGRFIYSTCTFARAEDEEIVGHMVRSLGAELLPLPELPGVTGGHFYPHLVRGEGLYMALLRKPGSDESGGRRPDLSRANVIMSSTGPEFELKGKKKIPTHALALRADFDPEGYARAEVDLTTALHFLRHEAVCLPGSAPRGLVLLTYGGRPLGWVNNLGNRANNLLPKTLRILKQIQG